MSSNIKIINDMITQNSTLFKYLINNSKFEIKFKKFKKFKTIFIIGMGGSILGAKAIYDFLKHKIKKNFIFIDNLDENYLKSIKKNNNLSKSLFIIISKSGNTVETISNTYFFKSFLKSKNTIILTENKNSFLRNLAKEKKFNFLEHKKFIGGRYSVLSEVGMLPAYLMGFKVENFKKNLGKFIYNKKIILSSANLINKLKIKNAKILVFFNYVPELNNFLYWSQQLFAESLGKNKKGFIPVISNAPKDHHSLLQLYLDGPKDKVFYIFSSSKRGNLKTKSDFFNDNVQYLRKKKYNDIKDSQKNAFLRVLKNKKIPFREINIQKFNEDTIGKLFLQFIMETIFLGKLINVNPFDQPAVEEVKVLTKKFLVSKKF
tara:strand:- start:82 stop:1206 length:1125 start_codon:yes stop_codon:yes gene_type:complete